MSHANIHKDFPVLFSEKQIADRTAEIGRQIDQDYAGKSVVLVGVLKGAAIFLADLARCITIDCTFDFVAVSSYGKGQRTSGAVKMIKDLDQPIEGKHVIIVEDILDTGLTLCFLRKPLRAAQAGIAADCRIARQAFAAPGEDRCRLCRLQNPQPLCYRVRHGLC